MSSFAIISQVIKLDKDCVFNLECTRAAGKKGAADVMVEKAYMKLIFCLAA